MYDVLNVKEILFKACLNVFPKYEKSLLQSISTKNSTPEEISAFINDCFSFQEKFEDIISNLNEMD